MRGRTFRRRGWIGVTALLLCALFSRPTDALMRLGGAASSPSTNIPLTRIFNNPTGSSTGSTAFWDIGQPFNSSAWNGGSDDVPSGDIITATLGGSSVPVSCEERKLAADGSLEWCHLFVNLSGASISGGGNATLQLSVTTGTWNDTTTRTNADWDGSNASSSITQPDLVQLTSLTAANSSTANDVVGSGTWNGLFDGGPENTVTTLATSPLGLEVEVSTPLVDNTSYAVSSSSASGGTMTVNTTAAHGLATGNQVELLNSATDEAFCTITVTSTTQFTCPTSYSGTVTAETPANRNLFAVMDYWVAEKSDTTLGPIRSWGPFVENTQLHLTLSALSTLTGFTYNVAFQRNGSTVRSYSGITTPAGAIANVTRPDAQGDWTADDPGLYVTQDYTKVTATGKVPPYVPGLSYVGGGYGYNYTSEPITSISGAVWTVTDSISIVFGPNAPAYASPVEVTASSLPGGINANTVYWAARESSSTLSLYDTQAHAISNGSMGLITPSSAGSGVSLTPAEAPGALGQFQLTLSTTGPRPDLGITSEWGAAYLVGDTQAWQNLGRVMAYDEATQDIYATEVTTGHIPSLLDAANTPAALGASYDTTTWGVAQGYTSNINGGSTPAGGTGGWNYSGSSEAHIPNTMFIPWLLEGAPFLRNLMIGQGDGMLALTGTFHRNVQVNNTGTSYTGIFVCTYSGVQVRVPAWHYRDVVNAAFAARNGSAEETYFRNDIAENANECSAYWTYKGTNYSSLGVIEYDEQNSPPATGGALGNPQVETFMEAYLATALAWGHLLEGDYSSGAVTLAQFIAKWLTTIYDGNGAGYCSWYATPYVFGTALFSYDDSSPGTYISSYSDLGLNIGLTAFVSFVNGSTTATLQGLAVPWSFATGDIFRPANYAVGTSAVAGSTTPPNPLSGGDDDYYINNISGSGIGQTFTLASGSSSGPPISITAGATTLSISAASETGGTVTITTPSAHGMVNNDDPFVTISGMTPSGYDNAAVPVANVVDADDFTYSASSGLGTVTVLGTESPDINGFFVPAGQTLCPPTGTIGNTSVSQADSYLQYNNFGNAIMAENNVQNASAAYTNGNSRYTGGLAACDAEVQWCGAP